MAICYTKLILPCDLHIKKKQTYEIVKQGDKTVVEKKGLDDQIRDGFDYEMTIAFELLNDKHLAQSTKDRSSLFDGKPEFIISEETGKLIAEWCEIGIDPEEEINEAVQKLRNCKTVQDLKDFKSILSQRVISSPVFTEAATKRYNEVNKK